jgi:hypothetical protein
MKSLLIAVAALLVAAPAASADTKYGGGTVRGTKLYGPSVSLLRKDDGTIIGRLAYAYRCRRQTNFPNVLTRVTGRANGASFTVKGRQRLGGHTLRYTLTGSFTADGAAGRIHRTGCAGFTRDFALRAAAAPAGAPAVPPRNSIFFGVTSQTHGLAPLAVVLRVAHNGRVYGNWTAVMKCGPTFWWTNGTPPTKIKPDGTFSRSEHFTVGYRDGTSETYRVRFAGRFLADGVTGTLRMSMQFHNNGKRYKTCRSGVQTWSARP